MSDRKTPKLCGPCASNPAVFFCKECDGPLCLDCAKIYKLGEWKAAVPFCKGCAAELLLTDNESWKMVNEGNIQTVECGLCESRPTISICRQCRKFICRDCTKRYRRFEWSDPIPFCKTCAAEKNLTDGPTGLKPVDD